MAVICIDYLEHAIVPAIRTAVQAVAVIVARQLILHAIYGNQPLVDPVAIAAYHRPEVGVVVIREVVADIVKTQHHVAHLP